MAGFAAFGCRFEYTHGISPRSSPVAPSLGFRQNEHVDELPRRTITRRSDEPKFQIGEIVSIKEGVVGIVLARFVRSDKPAEVHYIVELRQGEAARGSNYFSETVPLNSMLAVSGD